MDCIVFDLTSIAQILKQIIHTSHKSPNRISHFYFVSGWVLGFGVGFGVGLGADLANVFIVNYLLRILILTF